MSLAAIIAICMLGSSGAVARPAIGADRLDGFARMLEHEDSATVALGRWCRARRLAGDATITARPIAGDIVGAGRDTRRLLAIGVREPIGYRHVDLACGGQVLSQARNWYVPARLPAAMRDELAAGGRPFGTVIASLGFSRERLESVRGAGRGCPARTVLTNRALIRLASGKPLALVIECYQPAVLSAG